MLRIPHCIDNRLTGCGEVVRIRAGRALLLGRFLICVSDTDWVDHRTVVRLEKITLIKHIVTSLAIEPATFWFNRLSYGDVMNTIQLKENGVRDTRLSDCLNSFAFCIPNLHWSRVKYLTSYGLNLTWQTFCGNSAIRMTSWLLFLCDNSACCNF
jgi:hypothetical protein